MTSLAPPRATAGARKSSSEAGELEARLDGHRRWWRGPLAVSVAALSAFAGLGWLYLLFKAGIGGWGPRLGGALPLQQLAGTDGQALPRLALAWLPAGAVAGFALARLTSWRRPGGVAGAVTAVVLVLTGAASDAVANSQPVAAHLGAQVGRPGLVVSVLLAGGGAAGASHLIKKQRR